MPAPLQTDGSNTVMYEFIRMPDSSGFGDYTESGIVIPALLNGKHVNFTAQMYLDDERPIAGGREIWGFPKKRGNPKLGIVHDTLTGTLDYAGVQVAVGTMSYKHQHLLYDLVMHEQGIEPDWVIGTSIDAINGGLIAGNPVSQRLERLRAFWNFAEHQPAPVGPPTWMGLDNFLATMNTVVHGIPNFFVPNPAAMFGVQADVGVEAASYYSTAPLRANLSSLVDAGYMGQGSTRLTVGAVNARSGEMRYFDSEQQTLSIDHLMASGALPPAFPAVRIDGEPYWDGGIYSNTPIEVVLDDEPRRSSVIFAVNVWQPDGPKPESMLQLMGWKKDMQYASRAESHLARQKQIQHLRRVIRELGKQIPAAKQSDPDVKELASFGCGATMHVLRLLSPRLAGESHTKDIDFTGPGVRAR